MNWGVVGANFPQMLDPMGWKFERVSIEWMDRPVAAASTWEEEDRGGPDGRKLHDSVWPTAIMTARVDATPTPVLLGALASLH